MSRVKQGKRELMAIKKAPLLNTLLSVLPVLLFLSYLKLLLHIQLLQKTAHSNYLFIVGIDFSMFYAAFSIAQSTISNNPYDIDTLMSALHSLHHTDILPNLGFFYPPFFLLLIAPFSLLPYPFALFCWNVCFLCLYVYTVYKVTPTRNRFSIALAFSFPAVFFNLLWSQNGFLLTSILACLLRSKNSNLKTGLCLALLTMKPHFAILPYFMTIVNKKCFALLYSFLFIIIFTGISIYYFGMNIWLFFGMSFSSIKELTLLTLWQETTGIRISVQDSLRMIGASYRMASAIQIIFSLLIFVLNYKIRHFSNTRMKDVVLTSSVLLVTPYAMQYDLVLLSLPISLYFFEIVTTKQAFPGECAFLIFSWLLPLLNYVVVHQCGIQIAPLGIFGLTLFALRRLLLTNKRGLVQK